MKTYYSEYVQHCMRFYARHPNPKFRSETDKQNWLACQKAMDSFTTEEEEIIKFVYREGDTISDNIYNKSLELNIKQDIVWQLINKLEHKVAKLRKLI